MSIRFIEAVASCFLWKKKPEKAKNMGTAHWNTVSAMMFMLSFPLNGAVCIPTTITANTTLMASMRKYLFVICNM